MKLKFDVLHKNQPDPFIFEDGDQLYLYVTGSEGVEAYTSKDLFGEWNYKGVVTAFKDGAKEFWAPSVIKIEDTYYMYVSCFKFDNPQFMHVAASKSPLGPFENETCISDCFFIDSHAVKTEDGLYLWFAMDNLSSEKIGTRIFVDKLLDPVTPENDPKEVVVPTFAEEKFTPQCTEKQDWYTIEGPFWFQEGEWQYLMYSAGCYQDDTYHIGYCRAKTSETDLKKVDFEKVTDAGKFNPVIIKNDFEEGTGHHSVIKYHGEYYAIYHGRDYVKQKSDGYEERRTARICRLSVADGVITAERFEDHV